MLHNVGGEEHRTLMTKLRPFPNSRRSSHNRQIRRYERVLTGDTKVRQGDRYYGLCYHVTQSCSFPAVLKIYKMPLWSLSLAALWSLHLNAAGGTWRACLSKSSIPSYWQY